MKIAIALDGLLCDPESAKQEWLKRIGDESFLKDGAFWGALHPYSDIRSALNRLKAESELYVFAERPKPLYLPTKAWLKNNADLRLSKDHLILPALKRYDCRLLGIQHFVDTNPAVIENLKVEQVAPIRGYLLDRSKQTFDDLVSEILDD